MNDVKYPDLSQSKILAYDTETYDPLLTTDGPGVYRRDGNIVGFSLADDTGFSEYYNLGHKGITAAEKRRNYDYLRYTMGTDVKKVGANIQYDLDWTENWAGITVAGELNDIQLAEPLIDEHSLSFSLDALSHKYLGRGKYKDEIQEWCDQRGLTKDPRAYIYMMPYEVVRRYGQEDAAEPIEIFEKQWEVMKEQNLLQVYSLERKLIRPLLAMRKNGARLDTEYVAGTINKLRSDIKNKEKELFKEYGKFNPNSTKQVAKIFDGLKIPYKIKEKTGNPSITADDLEIIDHPIAEKILDVKRYNKTLSTFFINSFTESRVVDRLHTSFAQLKADSGGTITGRFSSSKPNLQQIPARHPYLGPLCRRAITAEVDCWLGKIDWSQIEYRVIAHYAAGPQSDNIREQYRKDPTTDYHEFVMALTGLERKPAKNLNFGAAYFMGAPTCSKKFHWSIEQAKELLDIYHTKVPFVRFTGKQVSDVAAARGYIKTITGRRSRTTQEMIGKRKTFVMFNHLIQGTAADIMKLAIAQAWDEGLFSKLIFHLTVHDELVLSIPKKKESVEAYQRLKEIMETCVDLKVPIMAKAEIGTNWQDVEDFDFDKYMELAG